jgi:hypothetical protein
MAEAQVRLHHLGDLAAMDIAKSLLDDVPRNMPMREEIEK